MKGISWQREREETHHKGHTADKLCANVSQVPFQRETQQQPPILLSVRQQTETESPNFILGNQTKELGASPRA